MNLTTEQLTFLVEELDRCMTERAELLEALMALVAIYGPSSEYDYEAKAAWERAEAVIAGAGR